MNAVLRLNGETSDPLIRVRNLVKTYKTPAGDFTAIKGLDVDVRSGEFVAIIGKSGSGKSTFINMLTGIDRPTLGEIMIGGAPIHTFDEAQMASWRGRNLGIVFQFFQLLPTLTLLENVILPMELNRLYSKPERRERAMQLLEKVEMVEQAHKFPASVSGGQQQRVAIARALANDPPLIVADEPTGNLDSRTAEKIFSLFEDLVVSGKTILMVTHDNTLARRASRTILIADGEIVNEYLVRALSILSQDQLVEVARCVQPQVFPRDASIIREGEVGDKFYIILEGTAEVFMNLPGGGQIRMGQLESGHYFGEMALLGNGIRTATVKAASNGGIKVAALDNELFSSLIEGSKLLRDELTDIVQQRMKANQLKTLSLIHQSDLAEWVEGLEPTIYREGQEIIRQGELGETFFIIENGLVDVFVKHDRAEVRVNQLTKGQYFGEMALIGNHRRNATVRVSTEGPASLFELDEKEFERLVNSSERFKQSIEVEAGRRRESLEQLIALMRGAQ
jgi:ABC-type lipoprotein export system ATPase subunit/CRP-like cAMP-binding protein